MKIFPLILVIVLAVGGGIYLILNKVEAGGEDTSGHLESQAISEPVSYSAEFVKPDDAELRERLTEMQYKVTQKDGTEPAFRNAYWDNKRPGLYVDIVSGEPLFSSLEMFDSGTGWPSFSKPLEGVHVVEKEDRSFGMRRIEVRSKYADSHLGHVFNSDISSTGLRYCINSAAMRFIPVEELESEGYGEFASMFEAEDTPSE